MEAVVAVFCDEFKWNRKKATLIVTACAILLGIPSSLGNGIWSEFKILGLAFLDQMDFLTNAILMPIGALLTCIFVGYVIKPQTIIDEVKQSSAFKKEKLFVVIIKYIAPICIVAILISSILDTFGIMKL